MSRRLIQHNKKTNSSLNFTHMEKWTTLAASTTAIRDEVNASTVVCLIGPPGIGKSTIVNRVAADLQLDPDIQVCHLDDISSIQYTLPAQRKANLVKSGAFPWWCADVSKIGDEVVLIEGNPSNKIDVFKRVGEIAAGRNITVYIMVPEPLLHYAACSAMCRRGGLHPDLYDPMWIAIARNILRESPDATWRRDVREAQSSSANVGLGLASFHGERGVWVNSLVQVCFEAGLHTDDSFASYLMSLRPEALRDFANEEGPGNGPANRGGASC